MGLPPGNNPVIRSSNRAIAISAARVDHVIAVEGHGEWQQNTSPRRFVVPPGAEIAVYQGMGVGLDDAHGVEIGQLGNLPARLPTLYDQHDDVYDTEPAPMGAVRENTPGLRIYRSGELCPNMTLLAYNEQNYPVITPPQPGSYSVAAGAPENLRDIVQRVLARGGSWQLRWGACTVDD